MTKQEKDALLDQELEALFATPQQTIRNAHRAAVKCHTRIVTSSARPGVFGAWARGTTYEQYYHGLYQIAAGGVYKKGDRAGTPKPKREEDAEQIASIRWFRATYPRYANLIHASAGGVFASKKTKARMGEMGYLVGEPDLFLSIPAHGKPGAYVEMKRQGGGTVSPEQKAMIAELKAAGYEARVTHGFREFHEFAEWWMEGVTI